MHDSPKVVYAAKNVQQAYLLKNTLEEAGIRAVVTNATLASGSGVDYVGWNTLARVAVDEPDYDIARQIALDYDRSGVEIALRHEQEEPYELGDDEGHVLHEWPRCPQCGAKRITRCPVCKTTGTDFPESDSEFIWGMGLAEVGGDEKGHGADRCQCGSDGSCSTQQPSARSEEESPEPPLDDQPERIVLMCPTCDEPFLPEFPRDCPMCDHRFDDGYEVELHDVPPEQIGSRVIALMVVLAVVLVGLVGYFMWVV
ncbi:MAG: DUF2007 domain-containing protein [Pirellulales bacterium]|nr:DUF2007 domain-containing protein [Pirellulales bacterium]